MKKLHYKQEMKYLNAVADYLTELGYAVEEPDSKHRNLLDVWGKIQGRKCFQEIYVQMWACGNGINGVWYQGDHEPIEIYLDPEYGLDDRNDITIILEDLVPLKRKKA